MPQIVIFRIGLATQKWHELVFMVLSLDVRGKLWGYIHNLCMCKNISSYCLARHFLFSCFAIWRQRCNLVSKWLKAAICNQHQHVTWNHYTLLCLALPLLPPALLHHHRSPQPFGNLQITINRNAANLVIKQKFSNWLEGQAFRSKYLSIAAGAGRVTSSETSTVPSQ